MNIDNKLIKISYINNSKFKELSEDKKEIFINKFNLIHNRMPLKSNLSISINKTINNGLINLINDNRECFINQIYIDFIENIITNYGGYKFRNLKHNYEKGFIFNNEDDYYDTLLLFIKYFDELIPNYNLINLMNLMNDKDYNFELNDSFIKIYMEYRAFVEFNKKNDPFYLDIIKHVLVHFISHDEMIKEILFYGDIIDKALKDKSLLDYYRMNYKDNKRSIPKDLVKRYNMENKIIR